MEDRKLKHGLAIRNYFLTKDVEAWKGYLQSLDFLDMIEAGKEMILVLKEVSNERQLNIPEELCNSTEALANYLQEDYLEIQVENLELEMNIGLEKYIEPIYHNIATYRIWVKEGLETNDSAVIRLNNFTKTLIDYEKRNNLYMKENWEGVEDNI